MTVIAYRHGVMAGDSMCVVGQNTKLLNERKVIRCRGHLIGAAGNAIPRMVDLAEWILDGHSGAYGEGADFAALVVYPNEAVRVVDQTGGIADFWEPYIAIGCGADCALGAMHAGADARQAVKAAIRWVKGCGGRVTSRRL